tara:strand:+ start:1607 stop:1981 length:375 start_codon:yes stop_codon:yes gene_type:complete
MTALYDMMHDHWANLEGMRGMYEGADNADLTFKFQGIVWKALIDEHDGYRSMLEQIAYADNPDKFIAINNLAEVEVRRICDNEHEFFNGWELVDVNNNHVWLQVGTDYTDQWYPFIIFRHAPIV